MTGPQIFTLNRPEGQRAEPHPDCEACEQERIHAERRLIANGALRLEVMDLKALIKQLPGGEVALSDYLHRRDEPVDHTLVPTCKHGRALSTPCRRCWGEEYERKQHADEDR
jgi:hypothetical protein